MNHFVNHFVNRFAIRLSAIVCAGAVVLSACTAEERVPPTDSAIVAQPAVAAAVVTRADIAQLKWLEGSWRGSGETATFYERYTFPNDSTMISYTLTDSVGQSVSDSSVYMLRDGQFGNGAGGPQWVLVAVSADSAKFEPVARAGNSFTWKRTDANTWMAVLEPVSGGNTITYHMSRMKN